MSKQALLNINILAAQKGAAELEFAVKKVHSLDSSKGPEGYVLAIERRVEDLVMEEVQKFQTEDNFLSKQSGHILNNSNVTWILKPIDGVENFINGYPHFAITLCSMVEDVITSAVVIDPIRREQFSASIGGGAELNNNKIRSSKQNALDDSMISFKKSNESDEFEFKKTYKELSNQKLNMRESGCLSLDLAYVGAGRLDAAWAYDVSLIDFAAGSLISQEGGSLVSDFSGNPKFLKNNSILSSTSKIYKTILKSIKSSYKN